MAILSSNKLFRRTRRLVVLLIIVGVVYLIFQLISIQTINKAIETTVVPVYQHVKDIVIPTAEHVRQFNEPFGMRTRSTFIHGVLLNETRYVANADGLFICFTSKEKIAFSMVNDDYCDCVDGSDEPGTSACSKSRFYCRTQLHPAATYWIPGSQVNDGVCDCCDGSDEWKNKTVPSVMIRIDKRLGVKPSRFYPCTDRCSNSRQEIDKNRNVAVLGARLKHFYLQNNDMAGEYGPHGVFYKLSLSCHKYKSSGYMYTVCPFVSVTQETMGAERVIKFNLGTSSSWNEDKMGAGVYELLMQGGDSVRCSEPRSSVITFICGLQDQVVKVSEMQKCVYHFTFTTPAAC